MPRRNLPARLLAAMACWSLVAAGACRTAAPSSAAPAASAAGAPAASTTGQAAPTAAAAPAPPTQPVALRPLKIQVPNKGAAFTFLYVAKDLGIFQQHGFDADLISMSSSVASAALQANELDFMAAIGTATRSALRGLPIRLVYVESTGPDQVLLGAKDLSSVQQLRGRTIAAYGPANNVNAMIVELLRADGLAPGDYELLNVGDGGPRAAALMAGQASGTLLDNSNALPLKREGYPVLDRVAGKLGIIYIGLAANTGALQSDRARLGEALRASVEAAELTHTQRERVLPIMQQEFDLSPDDVGEVYDGLRPGWTADGRPSADTLKFEFEMDQRELELPEPIRPEQVLDFSLLDEVQARR